MTRMTLGHRIDRQLIKRGNGKDWMLAALRLVEARRVATAPLAKIADRLAGRRIVAGSDWTKFISRKQGYKTFSPDSFPEMPQVIAASQAVYDKRISLEDEREDYGKPFFYNILRTEDLREQPILLDFALGAVLTEAVTGYLGHRPRLNSIGLFYSPINNTIDSSQIYHVDGDGLSQIKVFINIWPVGPSDGGFTFVSKPRMSSELRMRGLIKTLSDSEVFQAVPEQEQIALEGPPGSGAFVDTSRCLHQGSRARKNPRFVLSIQYVSRPDTLLPHQDALGAQLMITRRHLKDVNLSNPNAALFVE